MSQSGGINELVDHLFRHEAGKMVAVLTRILGLQNLETAQDIVQDTLIKAMNSWKQGKVPDNPAAWLYRAAKNSAIDILRKEKRFQEISPEYAYILRSDFGLSSAFHKVFLESEITDSQLRMIFACCHPSIPMESQIALTLKTLGGLSSAEIARAFLTSEETIAKRIYRAKEKIKSENIEMAVPTGNELTKRVDIVLKSIYLLFSEGYHSTHHDHLIREDLCHEAMRLCLLLVDHPQTSLPGTKALMALMCFQASRFNARLDDDGQIILMQFQDRKKWHQPLIDKGNYFLKQSTEPFEVTTYHLEAMIAAIHADAKSFEDTEWNAIYELYSRLYQIQQNPIVAMNKAIAASYCKGPELALNELLLIKELDSNPAYLTCLGDIYEKLGNTELAKNNYLEALNLASSAAVKGLIKLKLDGLIKPQNTN